MTAYSPCPRCHRHVKHETCPFCGAVSATDERASGIGRLSRAMVFAGAAITAACGSSQKKTNDVDDEQREMQEEVRRRPSCARASDEEIAAAQKRVDDAKTDEERSAAEADLQRIQMPMCAPYGAPPARRRVV